MTGIFAILGIGVAGFALARLPSSRIRVPLHLFVLSGVLWAAGDVLADNATDLTTKQVGISTLYTGSIMGPALWWFIALCWAEDVGARLPLRAAAWRYFPLYWAAAMWLVMITNPLHGAFLTPVVGGRNVYQPIWYMMTGPAYAEIVASLGIGLGVLVKVSRPAVRRQVVFMMLAAGITLLGNLLYVLDVTPVNPTVVVLSIAISMIVVAMARDGLFGVVPTALSQVSADHPNGVVMVDPDGYLAYANERARALVAPVVLPTDRPLFEMLKDERLHIETASSSATQSREDCWRASSGPTGLMVRIDAPTWRWIQVLGFDVKGSSDRSKGRLVQFLDVTERQEAEAQARQRRRLDSVMALAHSVSNDFRGAFTLIGANADLLSAELGDSPSQRYIARIMEAARIGTDLVQELETYTGSAESVHTPLDLAGLVDDACRLVVPHLPPGVRLQHRPQGTALLIHADRIQIRECVLHLIANAIEATAAGGGEIEVSTGIEDFDPSAIKDLVSGAELPAGRFAYVQVRDEGRGMHPEVEERAFEPFYSTREKNRGSGLSSVLGIARAHAAAVRLYNDPGWGCTFTVCFPLREE